MDKVRFKDLLPEEIEELKQQIDGLSSKEARKVIRAYKLKLDLPELTEEQREPVPDHFFNQVEAISILLIQVNEELTELSFTSLHPNAKALLLSQIKKTIGMLGNVVQKNGK